MVFGTLKTYSLKYLRQLIFDGNFSQAHLRQKNPEDDVWLTDGELFMVARARYREHLKVAIEIREVRNIFHAYFTKIYVLINVSDLHATITKLPKIKINFTVDAM